MSARLCARPRAATCFLLMLAIAGASVPAAARAEEPTDAPPGEVADEDPATRRTMAGMGVTETSDGPEASESQIRRAAGEGEWRYDTYYIFPATRHMSDSGLPVWGQVMLYPLAAAMDVVQLPVGALAGLAGE